jgi:hypothetical protein
MEKVLQEWDVEAHYGWDVSASLAGMASPSHRLPHFVTEWKDEIDGLMNSNLPAQT